MSRWDHPLGSRFEEPDAMVVFDDVLIPWERVFLHENVPLANRLFTSASIQNNTGHQTAIRGLAKCRFLVGVAIAVSRSVKTDVFLHVQEQLGEILGFLQLIEGALHLSEMKAERTESGAIRPAWPPLQAMRYHLPRMYERIVKVVQVIGAGGLLINPTREDLGSEIGPDIAAYYRGAGVDAESRIHLGKLAWDATGTQFGQRMLQYERYYAGDPVRTGATLYMRQNVDELGARNPSTQRRRDACLRIRDESLRRLRRAGCRGRPLQKGDCGCGTCLAGADWWRRSCCSVRRRRVWRPTRWSWG
jgi:aromatic ring hydroxylase